MKILKTRAEINETKKEKEQKKIKETKILLFEQTNKTDKPLARHIKKEKARVNNKRSKAEDINTDTTDIEKLIRKCYKQHYTSQFDRRKDQFLKKYKLSQIAQYEVNKLNILLLRKFNVQLKTLTKEIQLS